MGQNFQNISSTILKYCDARNFLFYITYQQVTRGQILKYLYFMLLQLHLSMWSKLKFSNSTKKVKQGH